MPAVWFCYYSRLMIGETVGNYRVTAEVGSRDTVTVYLAEHTLIGRQVQIQVLSPDRQNHANEVERFFAGARANIAMKHGGAAEIFDFGQHNGQPYIVMERLEGETLAARLQRGGRLQLSQALILAGQIADVLAAAEKAACRPVSLAPDAIMLIADATVAGGERVKVTRFIAADKLPGLKEKLNPVYMAPEQLKAGARSDHRADLYVLGCLLFEMVCGRPPFVAEASGDIAAQHIYGDAPSPRRLVPSLAPEVEQVILRLLAKKPDERWQSAEEVAGVLRSMPRRVSPAEVITRSQKAMAPVRISFDATVPAVELEKPAAAPPPKPKRASITEPRYIIAVVMTVLLCAVAAAAYWLL